ncbi:hypothetical protein CS063_00070 [Sporanaerobium hydrogeniformans]|uniref:Uncharacterized protein n=1 Tax=Sporanaerobium hydrogeniformans TaxID=3072179 RepID=A0AC61DIG9_9FIRM|nr:hypothetical protein [Sporanaerobium hydrogeniformans]PHV71912.1 hypothetical protein CS063_00070 [Sporanaerobium hydrogeniformans]
MRKLTGKHVFAMAKIIKAANIKEELGEIIAKSQEEKMSVEKVGIEGLMTVINACGDDKVEQRVYDLLDDVFEAKTADMSLEAIAQNFKQLAQENNLMSFFKSAGLLKMQK